MLHRLGKKILNRILAQIARIKDVEPHSLIEQEIYGIKLLVPAMHKLPRILKKHPFYSSHLARIPSYIAHKYEHLKIIDVGANIGDALPLFRQKTHAPILCIEGDDFFFDVLTRNARLFSEVSLLKMFLGEEQQQDFLSVIHDGMGTAYLGENKDDVIFVHMKTLSGILLEDYQDFLEAKFLKIDTDGYDGKIIRGSKEYLLRTKPVIFFEYDPWLLEQQYDDGLSIFTFLHSLNYQAAIIYTNVGDYLLSTELDNFHLLQELHVYYSGRETKIYCDICVFHAEDMDIFSTTVNHEIDFFTQLKVHPELPTPKIS